MKPLKQFSVVMGEQMLIMQSVSHKDGNPVETPLFLDEENNRIVQHLSNTKKQIMDLSKILMYSYELLEPQVTQ